MGCFKADTKEEQIASGQRSLRPKYQKNNNAIALELPIAKYCFSAHPCNDMSDLILPKGLRMFMLFVIIVKSCILVRWAQYSHKMVQYSWS